MKSNTSFAMICTIAAVLVSDILGGQARAGDPWVVYDGFEGPGDGKHVVLVSGDEEYRSEEGLPQVGKILAKHHGFKCTVVFAINPEDGTIDPDDRKNIPGLEALRSADLMVIATRFRDLPDDQMRYMAADSKAGLWGRRTGKPPFVSPNIARSQARRHPRQVCLP